MPGRKKNSPELTEKFIKAFTGPKKDPPLLTNLKWDFKGWCWVTEDDITKVGLSDNVFYAFNPNIHVEMFVCSSITFHEWEKAQQDNRYNSSYYVDHSARNLMNALYKVLTMDYYD